LIREKIRFRDGDQNQRADNAPDQGARD
jgi:hypothetical protein